MSATDTQVPTRERAPVEVGLFVTCLVDLFRPNVGFAALRLLEDAGCRVGVPESQTCCGQPAYNSGDRGTAQAIARDVIAAFEPFGYVVAPSGSCAGMLRKHYPALLADDPAWAQRAAAFGAKCHELVSFLTDVLGVTGIATASADRVVTYHDSCSGLRELGIRAQPRQLLASMGVEIRELPDADVCCGFGGTFCVKYPDISNAIVDTKAAAIERTGAPTLLAGDLGCLLNMAGKLQRRGSPIVVRHVAEVLAGMDDRPGLGQGGPT